MNETDPEPPETGWVGRKRRAVAARRAIRRPARRVEPNLSLQPDQRTGSDAQGESGTDAPTLRVRFRFPNKRAEAPRDWPALDRP